MLLSEKIDLYVSRDCPEKNNLIKDAKTLEQITKLIRAPAQAQCPACKEYAIVELPSLNQKICFGCHTKFTWHLKPNQKSVLIRGLVGT